MDDARPQGRMHAEGASGHEANSLQARGLIVFAASLTGVIVLVIFLLALVMRGFSREEKQFESLALPRFAGDTGDFPSPKIEADPAAELVKMKREDLGRLAEYGWVDRRAGIARIPIDRAIEILTKSGLPTQAPAPDADGATAASREAPKSSQPAEDRPKPEPVPERKP